MRRFTLLCAFAFLAVRLAAADFVFCAYNLENFVEEKPPGGTSRFGAKEKSPEAIAAQVRILAEIRPDILGVCEMGSREKLEEFRALLAKAGVDLPHTEYVAGPDEDRRLALLSRFPIVARDSQTDLRFELDGREEQVRRGILDVTVQIAENYRLRCVGVHLKSKLAVPEGDALIRRFESGKLRAHLDAILAADPETNLLCYGDFNDTKNEPMFQAVTGVRGTPRYMADLRCQDSLGDRWTHYWKAADQYSRIDYLFASPALLPEIVEGGSAIHRSPDWNTASDHRAIYTVIGSENRRR